MPCLEIGPGRNPLNAGWDQLDVLPGRTYHAEWGEGGLPIQDNQYDFIFASHVLEHVAWFNVVNALSEAYRILVPGGKLQIWVPDFRVIVQSWRDSVCGDAWRKHNPDDDCMTWVNGRIFTYGPSPNWHRCVFDEDSLIKQCLKAGFNHCRLLPLNHVNNFHGHVALGVEATK